MPNQLIEMDRRVLSYLAEYGGRLPSAGVPSRLFSGEIPPGTLNMVELGLIEHDGDDILITAVGRAALGGIA